MGDVGKRERLKQYISSNRKRISRRRKGREVLVDHLAWCADKQLSYSRKWHGRRWWLCLFLLEHSLASSDNLLVKNSYCKKKTPEVLAEIILSVDFIMKWFLEKAEVSHEQCTRITGSSAVVISIDITVGDFLRSHNTAAVDCTTVWSDVPGQRKCYTQTCSAVKCFTRANLVIDNSPYKFYACLQQHGSWIRFLHKMAVVSKIPFLRKS